jgi:hypothetical protein
MAVSTPGNRRLTLLKMLIVTLVVLTDENDTFICDLADQRIGVLPPVRRIEDREICWSSKTEENRSNGCAQPRHKPVTEVHQSSCSEFRDFGPIQ